MGIPHFLVIPYPIPGHVNPLMQLSHLLSKHGCKITFLNTEYSHKRTNNNNSISISEKDNLNNEQSQQTINFVTLPDGLEHEDDRSDQKKVIFSIKRSMPALLPKLIEDVNNLDVENKISCIVVTFNMGWALKVGLKLGIKGVLFWTASATSLACCYSIPKLIHDGIIDSAVPTVHHQSVIYVSFGSLAVMDQNQFKELALGLDLLNTPFLWIVRPSNNNKVNYAYPDEFHGTKGKIVGWAPQEKILNHPSIACFLSHCGWNSTIEGLYCGVPFLCWPFAGDQFLNKSYICEVWKVGLELDKDENGLITKGEIRNKVDQLLGDEEIKERSLKLKELTLDNIVEGGQSSKNLQNFINWTK